MYFLPQLSSHGCLTVSLVIPFLSSCGHRRFSKRFAVWVAENFTGEQHAELRASLSAINMPLPPFHLNAHNVACQQINNATIMAGTGLPHGEILEIAWSVLGAYGPVAQYMSRVSRQGWFERVISVYVRRCADQVPALLARWKRVLAARIRSKSEDTQQVIKDIEGAGLQKQEVLDFMRAEATTASCGPVKSAKALVVELKIRLEALTADRQRSLPVYMFNTKRESTAMEPEELQKMQERLRRLTDAVLPVNTPQAVKEMEEEGTRDLYEYEVSRVELELLKYVGRLQFLYQTSWKVQGTKQLLAHHRKNEQAQKKKCVSLPPCWVLLLSFLAHHVVARETAAWVVPPGRGAPLDREISPLTYWLAMPQDQRARAAAVGVHSTRDGSTVVRRPPLHLCDRRDRGCAVDNEGCGAGLYSMARRGGGR